MSKTKHVVCLTEDQLSTILYVLEGYVQGNDDEELVAEIDDIFEELTIVEETFPDIPPFEALRLYFTSPLEVCPTAMMDPYLVFLIEAEQAAREYNVLPYDGGLWDQPRALLNIFSAIRTERNHYERIRFEKIDRKMKSKGAIGPRKAGGILQSPNTNLPPATRNN